MPGLAWAAALKITKIKLELLTDPDMLLMFEKGIQWWYHTGSRTGMQRQTTSTWEISTILKKRAATLQYLDVNNLLWMAMSQPLPTGGFKWEKQVERFTAKKTANLVKNGRKGCYFLEVDVEYPSKLHKIHTITFHAKEDEDRQGRETYTKSLQQGKICGTYSSS